MSEDRVAPHPTDQLQLLLDGRLAQDERAAVEAHLRRCARCRGELAALQQLRTTLRTRLPDHEVPAELAARVTQALDVATAPRRGFAWGVAIAAGVLLAVGAWALLIRPAAQDPVAAAAKDFEDLRAGRLVLELQTAEPRALEQEFRSAGVPFVTRVFDFGMMNYRLLGGRVQRLGGEPSALFVYQGSGGDRVICQMYQGRLDAAPGDFEAREHDGIQFRVYHRGGLTLVFWQEGEVVCVLTAEGPAEAAIQLAYAKALKV